MINKNIRDFEIESFGGKEGDTFTVQRILRNAMKTPDGTIIHSTYRHDYVTHEDANGEHYMVDGGNEYLRRSAGHTEEPEDLSVYVDEDHMINREYAMWTSYGEDGKGPARTRPIKDLDTDHIQAILDNGFGADYYREMFEEELRYRCNKAVDES